MDRRKTITKKIKCNNPVDRPSLEMNEQDIREMVENIGTDTEEGKERLLDLIVTLCQEYDKLLGNEEGVTYELLEELDQALGERKRYYDAASKLKNHERWGEFEESKKRLQEDFRNWPGKNGKKSITAFYQEKCDKITGYNEYALCETTFKEALKEITHPSENYVICGHADDLPFLKQYEGVILRNFTYYIIIAFLNVELEETISEYIKAVQMRPKTHDTKNECRGYGLFLDIPPKTESMQQVNDDEATWRIIWGDLYE